MYLIHSREITLTPRALASSLGATRIRFPLSHRTKRLVGPEMFRLDRDFFTYYPPSEWVLQCGGTSYEQYCAVREFAALHKFGQRTQISEAGIPTPRSWAGGQTVNQGQYVIRPFHHRQRADFDIITVQGRLASNATIAAGHYASEWLPIKREYRTLFVRGTPLVTFKKNPLEGEGARRWQLTSLDRLGLLEQLRAFPPLCFASIAGVDLYSTTDGRSGVFEINFAPALSPRNLQRVCDFVLLRGEYQP